MDERDTLQKDSLLNDFILKLRLEKFKSDQAKAEETLLLLESILNNPALQSVRQLTDYVHVIGSVIQNQLPWDSTPFNITRRVIKIIKDEYNTLKTSAVGTSSTSIPLREESDDAVMKLDSEIGLSLLKSNVLEVLSELKAELEHCQELIAVQGETKIHSDEIVMTCSFCPTVLAFFLKASKKRRFHVIVAECAPKYDGHKMAKSLSSAGIQTTVIQDATIFPMMSRVNKVIIGCQTVFCNGGIRTFLGAASLACAAKYYSVPLYVCAPTFKFSSEMSEEITDFDNPSLIIPKGKEKLFENVNVAVARFDYVAPENLASFITNNRGISPSYVYRQVMELYHPAADDL